jgi:hypothetical protein
MTPILPLKATTDEMSSGVTHVMSPGLHALVPPAGWKSAVHVLSSDPAVVWAT